MMIDEVFYIAGACTSLGLGDGMAYGMKWMECLRA